MDQNSNRFKDLNFRLTDSIEWMEDHYDFVGECWFDVDAMFGTNINDNDEAWINFYIDYYPETDEIKPVVQADYGDEIDDIPFAFTEAEKSYMRDLMNAYVTHQTGYDSLREMAEDEDHLLDTEREE